ncbi:hypothetical protein, partial [Listeria welshimeri]|uniref:hypothetical protein n=1 Tax=Listeria welshimeri TaxID=1643 RepID=UPI001E52F894
MAAAAAAKAAGEAQRQNKPSKRARPDDTTSPREGKRQKPATPNQAGSVRYSDALKYNDLCVAILTEPFKMLTEVQA